MTFTVRNREGAQAIHVNYFSKREEGWAVYDRSTGSCEVAINTGTLGDNENALTVQAGTALLNGTTVSIEEQIVDVPVSATEPRKDIIALTQDGAVFRAGGNKAPKQPSGRTLMYTEKPAPPDLLEDPVVPLAIVAVPADATSITTSELRDIRPPAEYTVGTLNGTDPADFASDADIDALTAADVGALPDTGGTLGGNLTIADGDTTDLVLSNNGDTSFRLRTLPSGEVSWSIYDDTGTFLGTPIVTDAAGLSLTGDTSVDGALSATGALSAASASLDGQVTAQSAELSSTGQAGYSMGNGIHYTRDTNGRAVIMSASADGGDGWALVDPDGVGDAVTVSASGDMGVSGTLDAAEVLAGGTQVLTALDILNAGTAAGAATALDLGNNIEATLSGDTATLDVTQADGIQSISIYDSGVHMGEATEFNFTENLDADVTDGVASVASTGSGGGTSGQSTIRAIDYGADPTATDSSAVALQDAINAADSGDRVVWGEPGRYYLDDEILITKRIELDLHEGIVESDYHDEIAYPDDQQHYMPLFRVQGSLGADVDLTAPVDRGEDQVEVSDTTQFAEGDDVVLRSSAPNLGTIPGYDYMAQQTRIREIQSGVIYLEDNANYDYTTGQWLTQADYVTRPILKNIHIVNRRELAFDSNAGKVLGGFRHGIATEVCERPKIENCSARGYDSHLWSSRDDISPEVIDCEARVPMNLSGSCGEPIHIQSSRDVVIVRPAIKEARRAIDVRSGCETVTVEEPDITGVSHIGISWHSSGDVEATFIVNGGRVECKPTDPTHDNPDGTLDRRQEIQTGYPFISGRDGTLISNDVTYVGRRNAQLKGEADITGGEIYKYRTAGTVLTLDGEDITIDGTRVGSMGGVDRLVGTDAGTSAANVTLENVAFDCSGGPTRAVEILDGENITVGGHATDGAVAIGEVESGSNIQFDIDGTATGQYGQLVSGGSDITIEGRLEGGVANESIHITGGSNISIDADIHCSGSTSVRGVRIVDGQDIEITGSYSGPGIGVLFDGPVTGATVHDMRVQVTDAGRIAAVGTPGDATGIAGVKLIDNDLRGSVDDIVLNDDVTGFWATNNTCSGVTTTAGTDIGQISGNMIY